MLPGPLEGAGQRCFQVPTVGRCWAVLPGGERPGAPFCAAVAEAAAELGIVVEVLSVDVCDPSDAGEVLETLVPA